MSPFLGFLRLLLSTQSSPIGPFGARPLGPIDTTSVTSVTFDSCFRTHPHPCSVEAVKTRRRTALTTGAAVAAAALGLSACTARMDMTIAPSDTYDATLVMRDTTGTVLTGDTDCQDYADPSLVGVPAGTAVSSTPVGSVDDAEGVGCEVTVTGVRILDAEEAKESGTAPLVARDGDLYVVTLSAVAAGLDTAPNGSAGADSTAAGTDSAAPSAPAPPSASSGSLSSIVDAHLSITFPGAVVDAGGGSVSGRTVTWEGADALANGVSASGYATPNEGVSAWSRFRPWAVAGVVVIGLGAGTAGAVLAMRRRRSAPQRASRGSAGDRRSGSNRT